MKWLPEDDEHPVRPDLPWLRHLTFTEGHAIEIGVGMAVFMYLAHVVGMLPSAFVVLLGFVRFLLKERQYRNAGRGLGHRYGVADVKSDPWYFCFSALVTAGVLILVFGL